MGRSILIFLFIMCVKPDSFLNDLIFNLFTIFKLG